MTFEDTLQEHLSAIENRDLEAFMSTIANDGTLTIILPNGTILDDYQKIIDFHKGWFDDPDWSLALTPIRQWQSDQVGMAIFNVIYHDLDAEGNPYQLAYILSLIFAKQGQGWLLVHDQNTMLPAA
ncbi:MAG: nuclear transport factor 2 family protein [Chloroflexota bacterium]